MAMTLIEQLQGKVIYHHFNHISDFPCSGYPTVVFLLFLNEKESLTFCCGAIECQPVQSVHQD
jgi:hypothetical protein